MKKKLLLVHRHRHGVSYKTILTEETVFGTEEIAAIASLLNMNFEPDKGETIDILDITDDKPTKVSDKEIQRKMDAIESGEEE